LAVDAQRVMRAAGFAGEVHLIETSPVLRDAQKAAVPDAHWHESIEELPEKPPLLVANEFLDALPIHQHVDGVERRVISAAGGRTRRERGRGGRHARDRSTRLAGATWHRDPSASALASEPRPRGRNRSGAGPPHRTRSDGRIVQDNRDSLARLAGARGLRMTI